MSSTTIDTISQVIHQDPVPPRQLSSTIPGDLETICLKALHKEPERRYANCQEFAEDLERFVNDEPILARPVSRLERTWRWCKRNPRVAIPSSLAGFFIIATAIIATWAWAATNAQAVVIAQERDTAQQERDNAQKERDKAQKLQILADQQKAVAEDNEKMAQKQAELALKNFQFVLRDIDAQLKGKPGMSQIRLGLFELLSKKWDDLDVGLTGGVRGQAIPTLMAVRQEMALVFRELDKLDLAAAEWTKLEKMARERIALKNGSDTSRGNLAKILNTSAMLERRRNTPLEGIKKLEEALTLARSIIKEPNPQDSIAPVSDYHLLLAAVAQSLGAEMLHEGRLTETSTYFTEALDANIKGLEIIRASEKFKSLDAKAQDAMVLPIEIVIDKSRAGLAYVLLRLGKTEQALPRYQEALENRRKALKQHPDSLAQKYEIALHCKLYGKSLMWLDRLDDASPLIVESQQLSDEVWQSDPEKPDYKRNLAESCYLLANLRELQGRKPEAISQYERSRLLREQLYQQSPDDKNLIILMMSEASLGNVDKTVELADKLAKTANSNSELQLYRAQALSALLKFSEGAKKQELQEAALNALEKAVQEGFSDPFRIQHEIELIPLRGTERYQAVVAKLTRK